MFGGQINDRYEVCRIWEQILSTEIEFINSSGDPLSLLKPAKSPSEYYKKLCEYTKSENVSQSLKSLHNLISDLQSGLVDYKCSQKAGRLRKEGNDYFKLKDYQLASECYRRGLLVAPEGSNETALLHGNLSAVLFRQSKWAACVWEACLALRNLNDDHCSISKRLNQRLKEALEKLGEGNLAESHKLYEWISRFQGSDSKLSPRFDEECYGSVYLPIPRYGRNELRAFSSRLTVKESPKQGRYVVSEGHFRAGDVLASEPAGGWLGNDLDNSKISVEDLATASCILLPFQRHNLCFACHNQLESIGFVCPNCNDAAFCGPPTVCFAKHFKSGRFEVPQWHKDECRFIFLLNSIGLGHLSYRLGTLRERNLLRTDGAESIDNLIDHFEQFASYFEYALTGWLCGLLMERIGLSNAGECCFGMLRRLQCNAHAITEVNTAATGAGSLSGIVQERIGGGLFPAVSLINHACEPNIAYQFLNGFIVIRCIKDLHPGDEVLACYGPHFRHNPDAELRKRALLEQYFFECECEHCMNNVMQTDDASPEVLAQWSDFVRQIRSTETPLSQYKFLFDQLKKISILHSTLTPEPSYGEIADETAQRLLNVETASSSIEIQEVVIYLTNQSIDFVRDRFGPNSTEYAWELVKKRSVAKAFGLPGNDEDIMSFRRIIIVHYGEREAEKILKEKKLRYIFQ